MTTQSITITQQQQNINVGFMIKQFKIVNPSAFPIYVNKSGLIPTREIADFTIQPNAIFISPSINSSVLTVFLSVLDLSRGVPQITFTDTDASLGGASNTPFATAQYVGSFPGYPVTINSSSQVNLPPITIDRFQTVFIQMYATPDLSANNFNYSPTLIGVNDGGSPIRFTGLGLFAPVGGIVSYVPRRIPDTVTFRLDDLSYTQYTRMFNIIQTPDIIEYDYPSPFQERSVANGTGITILGGTIHPGCIIDLRYIQQTGGAFTVNAQLDAYIIDFDAGGNGYLIYSTLLNHVMNPGQDYAIKSKLNLGGRLGVVVLIITNNSGAGNTITVEGAARPI